MIKAEGGFKFLKGEKLINSMYLLAGLRLVFFNPWRIQEKEMYYISEPRLLGKNRKGFVYYMQI